ncbi:PREDICTED: kelch-like protein 13 [Gavialis gangeticus]|uniref:kelch-like protein 13 n=1 Tax=Gavialis gangeticus TaxID=94835 RepID=UPI00092E9759|nr:PREDICTED: kelch-like protein 13 [Gavialis gangeticus]
MLLSTQSCGSCLTSDTYLAKLLEGVSSLRSQNALCDVTLEADGVRFPAHKIILASASNYCKILFVGNAARAGNTDANIQLKAISARGLRNVLNFIYSNTLDLSLQNIEETFKAAEALLIREVIKLCFRFLEDCLNHKNCLDVLSIAKRLGPEELRQKATRYIGQHYKQILADPRHVKELDRATLCEILDKTDVEGCTELELFNAAICWLQHNNARMKEAADILRRIRLPLIPLRDLQRYVQGMPIMRTNSNCHKYLQQAVCYHSQLYAQPVLQTQHTNIRSSASSLLVVGGRTLENSVRSDMWATDASFSTWQKIGELCTPVYNHCVAVLGNFLFVIGGQYRFDPTGKHPSNEVFRFDPRNASWLQVAGMLERRTRFHVDAMSDHILAVGGGTLLGSLTNTMESYQPAENKWQFMAPCPMPLADHAGTTHKGILYISGGFSGGKALRDTHSYLPRLRRWVSNRAMTFARCEHGMATVKDRIFCIGGRTLNAAEEWIHVNETECYCPGTDQWTTLTLSRFDCCQFSITVHQSRLYITGGGSLRHMSKEDGIFVYDPEGRIWKKAGSLPNPLVDHASCMITLSHETIANQQERGEECSLSSGRKKSTLNLFITNKQEPQSVS